MSHSSAVIAVQFHWINRRNSRPPAVEHLRTFLRISIEIHRF
jgi:hypothetical protein